MAVLSLTLKTWTNLHVLIRGISCMQLVHPSGPFAAMGRAVSLATEVHPRHHKGSSRIIR